MLLAQERDHLQKLDLGDTAFWSLKTVKKMILEDQSFGEKCYESGFIEDINSSKLGTRI